MALVEDLVGITIPENIVGYLKNNPVGTIESYDSVYGDAYRVKAEKAVERSYVITCLLSAAIETVAYGDNAAKLDELLGTEVVSAVVEILTEGADFEAELEKAQEKCDALSARLIELQKSKQEIETKRVMDAFRKSGKSMQELMTFLEV